MFLLAIVVEKKMLMVSKEFMGIYLILVREKFHEHQRSSMFVALSTMEAEYISLFAASCQALWLRKVLHELKSQQEKGIIMFGDNQSSILLSKNPVFYRKSKHIKINIVSLEN